MNHDVFEHWNHRNSWALGLLIADGSFGKNARPHEFKLYSTNFSLLSAFRDVFETNKKITFTKNAKGRLGKKPVGYFVLSSPKIISFLKSINAHGPKEERNPFEQIPDEYKWSFVKGLFDGDGNFYKGQLSISGREHLITEVYFWICGEIGKEPNKVHRSTSSEKTFYFTFSKSDTMKIYNMFEEKSPGTYISEKYQELIFSFAG